MGGTASKKAFGDLEAGGEMTSKEAHLALNQLHEAGDSAGLRQAALQVIRKRGKDFTALTALGTANLMDGFHDGAIAAYKSAIALAKTRIEVSICAGYLTDAYSYVGNSRATAMWHDRMFSGRADYRLPRIERLPEEIPVMVAGSIGECLFHVTRLPAKSRLSLFQPTDVEPTLRRLEALLARSGFRTGPARSESFRAASLAAFHFGTTYPLEQLSYLKPDHEKAGRYRALLDNYPRPWVGLSWTGGSISDRSLSKNLPVADTVATFSHLTGTIFDLQHVTKRHHAEVAVAMREAFIGARKPLKQLQGFDPAADLDDTAAVISCLDHVITADNSNAYIAAAIGAPVMVLPGSKPYLYWNHAHYWPTARIIRTPREGWLRALTEVREAIHAEN
ncbi:MAG: hypothetical protein R3268_00180 [Acidiferrobacterales bacterium]|nr:hypothetical protein [Acidiferrobacterales bacterium]